MQEAFRRREEGLRKKDLELQEQLIKFNKFLQARWAAHPGARAHALTIVPAVPVQENEAKRQRAKKRAESEHKAFLAKRAELKEKQQELEELQRKSEELRQTLERNRRYEDYLVRVQEPVREDYPEVADLLNRHRTLRDAFHDLKKQQGEFERRTEETRREYGDYVKQRNTEILNQTNLLDRLKRQLEQTQLGAADLQTKARGALSGLPRSERPPVLANAASVPGAPCPSAGGPHGGAAEREDAGAGPDADGGGQPAAALHGQVTRRQGTAAERHHQGAEQHQRPGVQGGPGPRVGAGAREPRQSQGLHHRLQRHLQRVAAPGNRTRSQRGGGHRLARGRRHHCQPLSRRQGRRCGGGRHQRRRPCGSLLRLLRRPRRVQQRGPAVRLHQRPRVQGPALSEGV